MCRQRWQKVDVSGKSRRNEFFLLLLLICVSGGSCINNAPASEVGDVADSHDGSSHSGRSVKKELERKTANSSPEAEAAQLDGAAQRPIVVISERTLQQIQAEQEAAKAEQRPDAKGNATAASNLPHSLAAGGGHVQVEESGFKHKLYHGDTEISESYKTGFYFLLALSGAGIAFIMFKIHRMRLSRAERKYGVQGDRTTQELTPLPISIEDGNSDDEDQTLFEINRQQIRIL